MKSIRISIRLAMLGIAGIAVRLAVAAKDSYSRRVLHLRSVEYHSRRLAEEQQNVRNIERGRLLGSIRPDDVSYRNLEKASILRVSYHSTLKSRYQRAANWPWVSLPPDPPDPGESFVWQGLMFHVGETPWSTPIAKAVP